MQRSRIGVAVLLALTLAPARGAIEFEYRGFTTNITARVGKSVWIYAEVRATGEKLARVQAFLGIRQILNQSLYWPEYWVQQEVSSPVAGDFPFTIVATDTAHNSASNTPCVVHFAAQASITISTTPSAKTIVAGESVHIKVDPHIDYGNFSGVSFQWRGGYLDPVTDEMANDLTEPYEMDWRPAQPGLYRMRITPWLFTGDEQTEELNFTVLPRGLPIFMLQPASSPVGLDGDAKFEMSFLSRGEARVQWLHDDEEIADATNTTLVVTNVQLRDLGEYSARLENFAGRIVSKPVTLAVTNLPHAGGLVLFSNHSASVDAQLRANY